MPWKERSVRHLGNQIMDKLRSERLPSALQQRFSKPPPGRRRFEKLPLLVPDTYIKDSVPDA